MDAQEYLDHIERAAGVLGGVNIWLAKNSSGGPYWSVAGAGCQAGGHVTMREALDAWIDGCEVDQARRRK